jgi:hypothetical protein
MSDLAVIVPTRGRPDNIRKVISAWDFTNAWDVADLILVADADDPEIQGYREVVGKAGALTDGDMIQLVEVPVWLPMVHKLDAAAHVAAGQYWAVGFAGDDHLPQTIGWARRYLTVLREMGCGMVYSDDGYQGRKLATEWAVTSDTVRALGRMVPADVEHMYCDNSMMDLFGGAAAMRWLPEVRIEHMHPITGKAATDAQYQRVNGREQYARDRRGYERWKRDQAADDVAVLRSLRAGLPQYDPPRATPQPDTTPPPRTRQGRMQPTRRPVRHQPRGRTPAVQPPRHFDQVRAATPEDIMLALADFAAQVSWNHEIVELGVFCGRSALMLAWGAGQGNHAHVTGVDAWALEGNTYDAPFTDDESRRWADHWVQSFGYTENITLVNDFSRNVADHWSGPPVGLLFVDADHSKEGTRGDIVAWAPHLYFCARIAVDDYGHPDWPGVREAVDELVAEGFLEPIQIFHDRLAVTTLTAAAVAGLAANTELLHQPVAVTNEGVLFSAGPGVTGPPPAADVRVPRTLVDGEGGPPPVEAAAKLLTDLRAEWEQVDPEGVAALKESAANLASEVPSEVPSEPGRVFVSAGELPDVPAGTMIDTLSMAYLKELAKVRGIVLSTRVHKKSETIQALTEGH